VIFFVVGVVGNIVDNVSGVIGVVVRFVVVEIDVGVVKVTVVGFVVVGIVV